MMRWLPCAFLAVCSSLPCHRALAQADSLADTAGVPRAIPRTVAPGSVDTLHAMRSTTKKPGIALLLSAVLPGAGQVYNESYWKVPIVVGIGALFSYRWIDNNNKYRDYRDQYKRSLETSSPNQGSLLRLREFYRDERDSFAWYMAILYVLNLVDAYVDASLYDFDVGSTLSIHAFPDRRGGFGLRIAIVR